MSIDEMIEIAPAEALATLFTQLQRQATREVWAIMVPPYAVPADGNSVELERLASGVAYLGLYTQAALEEPGAIEMIRPYVAAGEQARMLPNLGMKLGIFDRKVAMVPLSRGRLADPAISAEESRLLTCSTTTRTSGPACFDHLIRQMSSSSQPEYEAAASVSRLRQSSRLIKALTRGFCPEDDMSEWCPRRGPQSIRDNA